eukprot:CAMPEP_0117047208 /NCGR_PEP_ID=MMETSP0472-20121206/32632_1 /TAXON_ID=693140 ORGANISM="Tiarina fusus, Strain LIS" /NCGR_SAMPLE_ID=MMETSP0472 /ASSEMBLY_ACC=CAM_ASM_000603 /LENGTH=117 /DNA_ID=CAMNT_0004759835 /DNA_START=5 /DNA_END=358 /DNA_ORIENTATION=+
MSRRAGVAALALAAALALVVAHIGQEEDTTELFDAYAQDPNAENAWDVKQPAKTEGGVKPYAVDGNALNVWDVDEKARGNKVKKAKYTWQGPAKYVRGGEGTLIRLPNKVKSDKLAA